ncbi:MAG TPA: HD domain-containing protein [Verrucomicrobiae bacterium]|nr:HD domain-containing protein [Verrucomicrobiae bacterium]
MSAQLLIQALKGFGEARAGLRTVLISPADQLFVYYICPLRNLRGMVTVGIMPNVTAPKDRADLSGQSVQAKRNIPVVFPDGKEVNVHECINLFWNPLNLTMRAFQRNGLLREATSKNPDDAVVCVLEINLERLILDGRCKWTIAPQNYAGTRFATFSVKQFTGETTWPDGTPTCDWRSIFSVASDADHALDRKQQIRLNSKRSAELIVHFGDNAGGTSSTALPFEMVERIIVPADQFRALTAEQMAFLNSTSKDIARLASTSAYYSKDELLKAEKQFIKSLQLRRKSDAKVLERVNVALKELEQFEMQHPEICPSREVFLYPDLADDYHGSMHAARVMFWSAFLAQHSDEPTKQELLPVVLAAAALHDTCREGSHEDETHGHSAVKAHQARIAGLLTEPRLLASCLNAIRYHCTPDEQCPTPDLVQQILKDADALDRGRFAPPNESGGCDTKFFRTEVLKRDSYKNIVWMAYWIAQSTRYSPIGSTPCADFSRSFCDAVNSLSKK